ncbi:MAG: YabP/YqfC family sporulation protein [Clostridia bacterium]|jgi:sporulation protein YqfC|nr:YabP/YqfC family sporulation protein [Clostridia bacterium]
MKNGLLYKSGLAPESAGVFKCSMYLDEYLVLENHNGILDLKGECIKIYVGKRVFAVFGENLGIFELDGCVLKIKGKIFKTEYLT